MRTGTKKEEEILRCDQIYYDASRNVAIATKADLELKVAKSPNGVHVRAEEIFQLNAKTFKMEKAEVYESYLPSDPSIVHLNTVTIEEIEFQKKNLFGYPIYNTETGATMERVAHRRQEHVGRPLHVGQMNGAAASASLDFNHYFVAVHPVAFQIITPRQVRRRNVVHSCAMVIHLVIRGNANRDGFDVLVIGVLGVQSSVRNDERHS